MILFHKLKLNNGNKNEKIYHINITTKEIYQPLN